MGIKEAAIYLDNQANTYYAGQTVNGRVEYVFDSPKKVRGIHVKFKGEAHCEWRESKEETASNQDGLEFRNPPPIEECISGHEEYFTIQYYVLGSNSGGEIEIPAGKHSYDFTCALPPVLPSSFEGQFGYVRYTVKATLDRPWKFDQETKMAFTVINALDLNLNPSYKDPIHIQMEKTFCCFCLSSPPLSVDVRTPVSGYCPGQCIPLTVCVENQSSVQVHLVKIFLRKLVTYRATTPPRTKTTKDVVHTLQEGPAPAGCTKIWNINLEIPPVPPSNLVNCSIIDLDYDLKVEVVVSGLHMNLHHKKYITIGTVPLVGGPAPPPPSPPSPSQPAVLPVLPGPGLPPTAPGSGQAGGWLSPGPPPSAPPYQSLYPTLTEPVYKASPFVASRGIADRGDNKHTQLVGAPHFAPNYPIYPTTSVAGPL